MKKKSKYVTAADEQTQKLLFSAVRSEGQEHNDYWPTASWEICGEPARERRVYINNASGFIRKAFSKWQMFPLFKVHVEASSQTLANKTDHKGFILASKHCDAFAGHWILRPQVETWQLS